MTETEKHPCRCMKVGRVIGCAKQYLKPDEYCQKDANPKNWQTNDDG